MSYSLLFRRKLWDSLPVFQMQFNLLHLCTVFCARQNVNNYHPTLNKLNWESSIFVLKLLWSCGSVCVCMCKIILKNYIISVIQCVIKLFFPFISPLMKVVWQGQWTRQLYFFAYHAFSVKKFSKIWNSASVFIVFLKTLQLHYRSIDWMKAVIFNHLKLNHYDLWTMK